MLVIWEVYYCLDILEDDRLARLKFSRVLGLEGDLEADFHEFVLKKSFQRKESMKDDVVYLRYKAQVDQAHQTDARALQSPLPVLD